MAQPTEAALRQLCEHLQVDAEFLQQCLQESVIQIRESKGRVDLDNGTTLHLRRLERICQTFQVDVPTALLLRELRFRVAELEEEVRLLRGLVQPT